MAPGVALACGLASETGSIGVGLGLAERLALSAARGLDVGVEPSALLRGANQQRTSTKPKRVNDEAETSSVLASNEGTP
jgi:hypothetical protein